MSDESRGAARSHLYRPVRIGASEGVPLVMPYCGGCEWSWPYPVPVDTAARMWASHVAEVDAK